jgi:serine/threonine protein kinase/tetratricopeptide (TPR) repeat protein
MDRQNLGPYRLERLLGRGGMGAVYLAHDARLSREVALKVLSPSLASSPGFRERFLTEARSCSRLSHPNITIIHEIGEDDGLDYIAFEYVEGENLELLLERDGAFSVDRALEIGRNLASALAHAHGRGIVHRDLKPANVILSTLGVPKILDFGLARAMPLAVTSEGETLARLTQAGMIVGTIAYMAPEQALGEAVDARSDVFSFGCLLYELLSGRAAFRGATPAQVLDHLLHGEPEPLEGLRPDVPPDLARIVSHAMRKSAAARHPNMEELARDLRGIQNSRAGARPASDVVRQGKAWRRPSLAAFAALACALALALFMSRNGGSPGPDSVAVLYFENLSNPEDSDHTARMLTELLTHEIAAAPEIPIVSRQRVHDVAARLGIVSADLDRNDATRVAREASLGRMVVGQVAVAGDRIMASAEIVDVQSGRSLSSERAQVSSSEDLFVLAQSLGAGLREELLRLAEEDPPAPVSTVEPTDSVDAYRLYVEGETALQQSDFDAAVEQLSEAVRLDPEFSLAQFRLSMAARWISDAPVAHQAARRAAANLGRAPAHLRDVVQANALYQDGAYSQAIPLLEQTLAREPEQKEALYILGQIYVHSLRDSDPSRAIDLMEKLLTLDPGFHQVYDRLALSYAFQGDLDRARSLLSSWNHIRPDKVEGLRSILATFEGQPEEALGFGQAFSWIEGPLFQTQAALMASRWEVARSLTDHDPDEWRSDHLRAWALRNRAVLETYLGEFDSAVESYRRAGMASGLRTDEGASGGVPASSLQLLAELYLLGGEPGAARGEVERALGIQPESFRGLYYAGRTALLDGDTEQGARYLSKLGRLPAAETSAAAQVYLRALEGEMALAQGDGDRARAIFEEVIAGPLMLDWATTCSSSGAAIRDGLVRTYLALGRDRDAVEALEDLLASGAERVDHPAIYTQALYRLGVLKLESGRREEGRRLLSTYLAQWGSADWELESVADARARLDALANH